MKNLSVKVLNWRHMLRYIARKQRFICSYGFLLMQELKQLADELRSDVVFNVSKTGGHLGSSLGVVELTVALHYVFNAPQDRILWDVGHQVTISPSLVYFPLGFLPKETIFWRQLLLVCYCFVVSEVLPTQNSNWEKRSNAYHEANRWVSGIHQALGEWIWLLWNRPQFYYHLSRLG